MCILSLSNCLFSSVSQELSSYTFIRNENRKIICIRTVDMDIASNGHHRGNRAKTIVGAALAVIAASTAIIGVDIASFMNTQASLDAQYSETPIISSIRSGYSWKVSNAVYRSVADTDPIVRYSADRNIPENLPSYPVSASVAHEHGSVEFVDSSSIESLDSSYPPPPFGR